MVLYGRWLPGVSRGDCQPWEPCHKPPLGQLIVEAGMGDGKGRKREGGAEREGCRKGGGTERGGGRNISMNRPGEGGKNMSRPKRLFQGLPCWNTLVQW